MTKLILNCASLLRHSNFMPMFFSVGYILNVTREIDNFFPESFTYMNIRLYDVEASDLLPHWTDTYKFINTAR